MEILKIENLTNKFEDLEVLKNLNLSIKKGEFVSIVGPSGCGKTTLFRLITGLIKDYEGSILVDNVEAKTYSKAIAYMPQKDMLLPFRTLYGNAKIPLEIRGIPKKDYDKHINPLLKDFLLEEHVNHYPSELSGGLKQRAALLRTFLIDSELMLLDEPFGALDAITRHKMQKWLLDVWEKYNHTVLFITHDIDEALFLSDKVYVMSTKPGEFIKELNVEIERPRKVEDSLSETFINYKKEIMKYLE